MAVVNYAFTPGQAVFIVKPETFGIGKATIVSVQITADPLVTQYVVQYIAAGRSNAVVAEADIFALLADALVAYEPLVM